MTLETWAELVRMFAVFIAGFAGGMVLMAVWHHRAGERVTLNRVLAVSIFLVVAGGSLLGVWNSYAMRAQAECQSQVNAAFLETLSVNTELNSANRDNLDSTIERLAEAGPDDDGRGILADYLAERDRIEEQRRAYPPLPEEVCE